MFSQRVCTAVAARCDRMRPCKDSMLVGKGLLSHKTFVSQQKSQKTQPMGTVTEILRELDIERHSFSIEHVRNSNRGFPCMTETKGADAEITILVYRVDIYTDRPSQNLSSPGIE